ncbi:MAG: hypothetical protein ABIS86_21105 [Streptosporangiaceae bacterium]
MPSFPVVPSGQGPLDQQGGREVARPSAPRLHQAGKMGLSEGAPLRDELWARISPAVQGRLTGHAGTVIEWFADEDTSDPGRRPFAVLYGDRGLAFAEPRLNTEHRPVYAISRYELDPASYKRFDLDHRPPPTAAPRWTGPATPSAGPPAPDIALNQNAKNVLGNLPAKAQELLQAPFLGGEPVRDCNWYYLGHPHHLTMFFFFIAGPRSVTAATGTKLIPVGHTDATAHWSLRCHRTSVVRRVGR